MMIIKHPETILMWHIGNDICSSTTSPPCWLVPLFQIFNYFHPAYTPPSSKFIPAINDRYVSPILFVDFKTPQSNLLQTQPPQTCDNIWTTRPSQAPQEAPRRCQGAPQAPWWGGGLSCGAPSPIIWTAAADRRMPLTCLCRFYSSINVCFRFQDQNGQKISWRMWPHIWPTKGGGDMKQGGRQGSIREGIFNLVTRRLVGFMGEMKRGKTRLLPDNWN